MKTTKKQLLSIVTILLLMNAKVQAQWYTFIGSGSWSSASNWDSIGIPPNPISIDSIYIKGYANLDINQTMVTGADIGIFPAYSLIINPSIIMTNNMAAFSNQGTIVNNGILTGSGSILNSAMFPNNEITALFVHKLYGRIDNNGI